MSRRARTLGPPLREFSVNPLPLPVQTRVARQWLEHPDARIDRVHRALLSTIDGHRNVIELESVARAMGLEPDALDVLRQQGFIDLAATGSSDSVGRP
jgi:hypothetical protein